MSKTLLQLPGTNVLILGPDNHRDQGWQILWTPVQGVPWSDARLTYAPYALQRGRGCRNLLLGDGDGANRGGHGENWPDNLGLDGILLC